MAGKLRWAAVVLSAAALLCLFLPLVSVRLPDRGVVSASALDLVDVLRAYRRDAGDRAGVPKIAEDVKRDAVDRVIRRLSWSARTAWFPALAILFAAGAALAVLFAAIRGERPRAWIAFTGAVLCCLAAAHLSWMDATVPTMMEGADSPSKWHLLDHMADRKVRKLLRDFGIGADYGLWGMAVALAACGGIALVSTPSRSEPVSSTASRSERTPPSLPAG